MKQSFALFAGLLLAVLAPSSAALAQEHVEIAAAPSVATASQDDDVIRRIPYVQGESPEIGPDETAILNPEKTEWTVRKADRPEPTPLPSLYAQGGSNWMNVITLCLIAMCFAAWKAPRWVKEIGLLALWTGFLSMMVGVYGICHVVQSLGYPISFTLLCGGIRVALIAPLYGTIVYMVSLLLRIAVKPRM
ncbi:MAG: hypothetical protein K2G58_05705 [Alistipes sp.]|nr:hypothetical protein [Alistipes sp.]